MQLLTNNAENTKELLFWLPEEGESILFIDTDNENYHYSVQEQDTDLMLELLNE